MAWQLVYTSAPKLLEAGRTGFGTVARHRAVSGLLATTVERLSQFARLPGHDPQRVIYCHRLIRVGSSEYHVLSCLRDAGSDYTGRTNHLAHHLIAETREITPLLAANITPADVLRAMPWRTEWSEGARFFEAAEEINLATLSQPPTEAWPALTGEAGHARLPWSEDARRGSYWLTPPLLDLLPLISESLQERPSEAWTIPFTTSLEPNDDVADFKWIGLPVSSPLRSQAENSSRQILNLSAPATLPPPPAKPDPPVEPAAVATTALPSPSTKRELPLPSAAFVTPGAAQQTGMPTSGGWSPERHSVKTESKKTRRWIGLAAAALLVLGAGGFTLQKINTKKEQQDYTERVEKVFSSWKLDDTKSELKTLKPSPDAQKTLDAVTQTLEKVKALAGDPKSEPPAQGDGSSVSEPKYSDFIRAVQEWHKAMQDVPDKPPQNGQMTTLTPLVKLLETEQAKREKVNSYRTDSEPFMAPAIVSDALATLYRKAVEHVSTGAEPEGTSAEWKKLLDDFGKLRVDHSGEPAWIKEWTEAGDTTAQLASITLSSDAPEWLKNKVAKAQPKPVETVAAPTPTTNNQPVTVGPAPKSAEGKYPISLVVLENPITSSKVAANISEDTTFRAFTLTGDPIVKENKEELILLHNIKSSKPSEALVAFGLKTWPTNKSLVFNQKENPGHILYCPDLKHLGRLLGYSSSNKEVPILEIRVVQASTKVPVFADLGTIKATLKPEPWKLPDSEDDKNIAPKVYTIILDEENKPLRERLASILDNCHINIGGSKATFSTTELRFGEDIVRGINEAIERRNDADTRLATAREKERNFKTTESNDPNLKKLDQQNREELKKESEEKGKYKDLYNEKIVELRKQLTELAPPIGKYPIEFPIKDGAAIPILEMEFAVGRPTPSN